MSIQTQQKDRIKYLGRKLSEGKLILFTGAGFSSNAKDMKGRNLPLAKELAKEISNLIGVEDSNPSLKEIFEVSIQKQKNKVSKYLQERLTVDSSSLNDIYKVMINQPWYKIYTVNIDDIFSAAQAKFNFDRRIFCVSNYINNQETQIETPKDLMVIYLHGMLSDIPDDITFSKEQYFEKMAFSDSYYNILASEILQYPFIFLGNKLDEDIFWHYIYLRRKKGGIKGLKELRPNSIIVVPELSNTRQELLKTYNITWIPQTCEEFCQDFLIPLQEESKKGFIKIKSITTQQTTKSIPVISDLITVDKHSRSSHYLLGAEPSWKDISSNLAIKRDKEPEWLDKINSHLKKESTPIFIFTGTAGDGKTSIAMRVALHLSNQGQTVGWIDRNSDIPPHRITHFIDNTENLESLFIDTPDIYGLNIPQIISNIVLMKKLKFIALIIRSSKMDTVLKGPLLDNSIHIEEFATYPLTDNEIIKILDLLKETHLEGVLKQKNRLEQVRVFKEKSNRQLIVAMIEATSGKDFVTKICDEFEELGTTSRQIYCLVSVATSRNHSLLREDILLGFPDRDNTIINEIDKLLRRGLFIEDNNFLKVRHRVIAQKVSDRLSEDNKLIHFYTTLAYIAAIRSTQPTSEQKRMKRLLKALINHKLLLKISSDAGEARNLYETIEELLKNEHHFWLQRGCFELARGDLSLARNYLNQSSSLNNLDPLVILSIENLNFKVAIANPNTEKSSVIAKAAYDNIVELIDKRGNIDPYPYHVLGNQGLYWAKKGIKDIEERKKYLEKLLSILKKGVQSHKRSNELIEIRDKVQKEILNFFLKN